MKDSLLELEVQKTTATMAVGDIAAFKAEFTDVLRTFDDMMKPLTWMIPLMVAN